MLNLSKYTNESITDGNERKEKELVYHAILKDMSVLQNAAKIETQEQWEIKIPKIDSNSLNVKPNLCSGRMRVRKINNGEKYIFCSKTKDEDGNLEVELESTEDQFNQFYKMSTSGMYKTRYCFPIEGTEGSFPEGEFDGRLVWEIDVFKKHPEDESVVEWVKIDLELPENFTGEIPNFPFETNAIIYAQYGSRTDEDEALISNLYEKEYCLKH